MPAVFYLLFFSSILIHPPASLTSLLFLLFFLFFPLSNSVLPFAVQEKGVGGLMWYSNSRKSVLLSDQSLFLFLLFFAVLALISAKQQEIKLIHYEVR